MSSNKELYNIVGQLTKKVLSDIVDKAIETTKQTAKDASDFMGENKESTHKNTSILKLSDTELMELFLESYDGVITPSWNRVELCFVDGAADREFKSFKKGYLVAAKIHE